MYIDCPSSSILHNLLCRTSMIAFNNYSCVSLKNIRELFLYNYDFASVVETRK